MAKANQNVVSLRDSKTGGIAPGSLGRANNEADENYRIYRSYRDDYSGYRTDMSDDWAFGRLNQQWTDAEVAELKANKQPPLVFNDVGRIGEQLVAMLAGQIPRWAVLPRTAGARDAAEVLHDRLSYVFDISDGRQLQQDVLTDMVFMGTGAIQVFFDPNEDHGAGDIKIGRVHPLELYVDPCMRDRLADTAENVVISKLVSRSFAASLAPHMLKDIEKAPADHSDEDYMSTVRAMTFGQRSWAYGDRVKTERDQLRIIDRYTKVLVPHLEIRDPMTGERLAVLPKKEEKKAREFSERWDAIIRKQYPESEGVEIPIREVNVWQVRQVMSLSTKGTKPGKPGGLILHDRVLPITRYPVVPFFNRFSGNPFAESEVRGLKSPQEFKNKMMSLLVKQATGAASGGKALIHENSGPAYEDMIAEGAKPNGVIRWQGDPHHRPEFVPPMPMTDGIFQLVFQGGKFMDAISGMFTELQGAPTGERESARLRAIRNEEAGRRPDMKLASVESAMSAVGKLVIEFVQHFDQGPKIFHMSDRAGQIRTLALNQMSQDPNFASLPAHQVLDGRTLYGDINAGQYDVVVVPGSTKPTNRSERLEEILTLAAAGHADTQAVLERYDAADAPEILERMSNISQLSSQLQGMQQQLQESERRRYTAENETDSARRQKELEQFRGDLAEVEARLNVQVKSIEQKVRNAADQNMNDMRVVLQDLQTAIRAAKEEMTDGTEARPTS